MLPILHPQSTAAAALTRPVVLRRADEGRSADLRGFEKSFGGNTFGNKPELCRMPSALLTLDPSSYQQEGSP